MGFGLEPNQELAAKATVRLQFRIGRGRQRHRGPAFVIWWCYLVNTRAISGGGTRMRRNLLIPAGDRGWCCYWQAHPGCLFCCCVVMIVSSVWMSFDYSTTRGETWEKHTQEDSKIKIPLCEKGARAPGQKFNCSPCKVCSERHGTSLCGGGDLRE